MSDEIKPIRLTDAEGEVEFRPDDLGRMTTHELALIVNLFHRMSLDQFAGPMNWRGYLREYGLERHFKPVRGTLDDAERHASLPGGLRNTDDR